MCCESTSRNVCECVPYNCCWYLPRHRFFLSKEEEIEVLERYRKELEKEIEGIKEKMEELRG